MVSLKGAEERLVIPDVVETVRVAIRKIVGYSFLVAIIDLIEADECGGIGIMPNATGLQLYKHRVTFIHKIQRRHALTLLKRLTKELLKQTLVGDFTGFTE